ncbi:hypothetical protein B0I35DRAFT_434779 [Stachybotrys elegans]|uniref:Uncharacterized protein n=1 Tax=Stachybotrys elegans TaxID=80388 RepID=A0A8K0WPG4_9HYPO|nr:hypothetical protein B0I35DRAFT_434779 [Stachybotrys elegans]
MTRERLPCPSSAHQAASRADGQSRLLGYSGEPPLFITVRATLTDSDVGGDGDPLTRMVRGMQPGGGPVIHGEEVVGLEAAIVTWKPCAGAVEAGSQ